MEVCEQEKFNPRNHTQHMQRAREWEAATTYQERQIITIQHGVRYSVFNRLSYWKLIEHSVIDLMHSWMLGILKDHSQRFLNISAAAKNLDKILVLDKKWRRHNLNPLEFPFDIFISSADPESSTQDSPGHTSKWRRLCEETLRLLDLTSMRPPSRHSTSR